MNPHRIQDKRGESELGIPRIPGAYLACGICVVVWLIQLATTQEGSAIWENSLGQWMAMRTDSFDLRTFLTHHFLHENSIHLFANLACVLFAARILELRWGSVRFLAFYIAAALGCGSSVYLVEFLFHTFVAPSEASISFGASGVALACLTAYTLTVEDRPILGFLTERYLIWSGILLGATFLVFLQHSARLANPQPAVLFTPQLSGIILGGAFGLGFLHWERRAQRRIRRETTGLQQKKVPDIRTRVDQLLDKIHRNGMESLSPEEQSFLREASKHFRNHPQ